MRPQGPVAARTLAITVALALSVFVEPALAAPADVGENLGGVVKSWAAALLFGTVCLVGLGPLAKRELGQIFVVALGGLVLGAFIFAEGTVVSMIRSLVDLIVNGN